MILFQQLGDRIIAGNVQPDYVDAHLFSMDIIGLIRGNPRMGQRSFNHKLPIGFEMLSRILETTNLILSGKEIKDSVEDQVD